MVSFLLLSVALEEARSVLLDIVIEEALWGHGLVVTLRHRFVIGPLLFDGFSGQEIVEIFVSKLAFHPLVQARVRDGELLVEAKYAEQAEQANEVKLEG